MPLTLEALEARRGGIQALALRYGVRRVLVFGSVARGEAGPESDLDLLVELGPGRTLLDLGGFQYELVRLLGCRVDAVTPKGLKPRLRDRVLAEARPL